MTIFSCRTAPSPGKFTSKDTGEIKIQHRVHRFQSNFMLHTNRYFIIFPFQKDIIISRRTHIRGHGVAQLTKSVSLKGMRTHFGAIIAEFPGIMAPEFVFWDFWMNSFGADDLCSFGGVF
ncbi:hypothetical protein CDAR_300221 [Caerostris darwini]|uniref:Uncharacterized protein n=1 Tax=Caerostris darwini TaxID=1538125 RepID=A0AAV4W3C4_9ARAC|nr:hypothetical protein CDAR_300221 [Caerostris darwini]